MSTSVPQIADSAGTQAQQLPPVLPHNELDKNKKQIVIVGGGISGVSTAYYLQRMGKDVLVVESLPEVGQAATRAAVPLLKRYQAPIVKWDMIEKRKSQFCPIRMWYRAQQLADNFTIKSWYNAYGFSVFKTMLDNETESKHLESLTLLTQSNYAETLNVIKEEKIPMSLSNGHLFVADDRSAQKTLLHDFRRFRMLYKDCDMLELTHDDPAYLFPALQQENSEMYGGMYTPSSLVFHPTLFSQFLHKKIVETNTKVDKIRQDYAIQQQEQSKSRRRGRGVNIAPPATAGKVEFMFNTKAVGFTLDQHNTISSLLLEHQQEIQPTAEETALWEAEQAEKVQERLLYEKELGDSLKGQVLPGVNAGELSNRPKAFQTVSTSEVGVDKVVLCNGYQAFQITEHLRDEGPLLHVVPVRSLTFDIYDKTRARFEKTVPSLFPTYPTTYYPEDPEFVRVQAEWEAKRKELGIDDNDLRFARGFSHSHPLLAPPKVDPLTPEEIEKDWTQKEQLNMHGVSAVEFARNGLTLVQDLHNPRHIYGYMGKDTAQIGDDIQDRHLQSIMGILEGLRKIPEGSLSPSSYESELVSRRVQNRRARGGRYLSMQPNTMAMHTIGKDGLPVIGATPYVPNLYFNTGHGTAPQNTAVIGGKMIANIIADPKFQQYTEAMNQNAKLQHMASTNAAGKVVFDTKPTQFDLDRLFNVRSTPADVESESQSQTQSQSQSQSQSTQEEDSTTATITPAGSAPVYLPSLTEFSPARWALHKFSPTWFDDPTSNTKAEEQAARAADERRAEKRRQIQERLAARNANTAAAQAQQQQH